MPSSKEISLGSSTSMKTSSRWLAAKVTKLTCSTASTSSSYSVSTDWQTSIFSWAPSPSKNTLRLSTCFLSLWRGISPSEITRPVLSRIPSPPVPTTLFSSTEFLRLFVTSKLYSPLPKCWLFRLFRSIEASVTQIKEEALLKILHLQDSGLLKEAIDKEATNSKGRGFVWR